MIAWWIWLSTLILGSSALGVRALPVLSVLLTSIAVFGTGRLLWNHSVALRAVLWFNAMILVSIGAVFSTPDAPSTMFWALTVWALSAIYCTKRSWLWIAVGLLAGLGCVSKYTNLFLGLGVISWLFIDPTSRHWYRRPWLWAGGLMAGLVFLPVFLWNQEHDWISFSQQFGRMTVQHITPRYLVEFFASQFGLLNPLIAYFTLVAVVTAFREPNGCRSNPSVFLISIAAPLVAYMMVHAFHDRVQANWLAPIYPQLALLAAAARGEEPGASDINGRLARAVVPLGCAISNHGTGLSRPTFRLCAPFWESSESVGGMAGLGRDR